MSRRSDRAFWRGYNKQTKEWMYGSLVVAIIDGEEVFLIVRRFDNIQQPEKDLNEFVTKGAIVAKDSIGQYTGYDDDWGFPIFEGDYVKTDCDGGPEWHKVEWDDQEERFHLYAGSMCTTDEDFQEYMIAYDNEVDGNAYECDNDLKPYPWEAKA